MKEIKGYLEKIETKREKRTKYQPPRIEQHSFFPNRENPNANSAMDLLALYPSVGLFGGSGGSH